MPTTNNPLISVIISAYNHQDYIARCLRSLIAQNIPNYLFEIVIVDDFSDDNTFNIAQDFCHDSDCHIKIIRNDENLGLPASLNKGIEAARGNYIVRVDSDDYVNSLFLPVLSYYLDTHPQSSAVACDYYLVNDNEDITDYLCSVESPIACGVMFRYSVFEKVGFYNPQFKCREGKNLCFVLISIVQIV